MFVIYDNTRTVVLIAFVFEKEVHRMRTVRDGYCKKRVRTACRRNHTRVRQRAFLLCILCLVMIFSCGYALASDSGEQKRTVKYYTSVEIQDGDTLWDLAGSYAARGYSSRMEYIDEIRELNHLTGDKITAGGYLTVPYYGAEVSVHRK